MYSVIKIKNHFKFYISTEKYENEMNLLLTTKDENKHCF